MNSRLLLEESQEDSVTLFKGKLLLFDSDVIIDLYNFGRTDFIDEMKQQYNVQPLTLETVYLELSNSKDKYNRTRILDWVSKSFQIVDITPAEVNKSRKLALTLVSYDGDRSATDLYLGATAWENERDGMLLLSGDLKAFPPPVFDLKGIYVLYTQKLAKRLSIYRFNPLYALR